jgi:hypothetical protein
MPESPRRPVSRTGRMLDLLGLALILAGAACYLWAYAGMRALEGVKPSANPTLRAEEVFTSVNRWGRLNTLSRVGVGLIGAGLVVAVGAAVAGARRGKVGPATD